MCNCEETIDCECPIKDLGTHCIIHTKSNLPNLNIGVNTQLSTILEKIDEDVPYFKMGIVPKGVWNSSVSYNKNDAVNYEGSAYISLVNGNTSIPSESNLWTLWVSKGDKGDKGDVGNVGLMTFYVNDDMDLILETTEITSPYIFGIDNNGNLIINN